MGIEFDASFWKGWGISTGMLLFMGLMVWLGTRGNRRR